MPRVKKSEREAFMMLVQFIEGSSSLAKTTPWLWLDGMTTERVYALYDGDASLRSVTTRLLRYIGREYLTTEVCREGGKVCRKYKALKLS